MTGLAARYPNFSRNQWRIAGWGVAAGLLLLPLIGMQVSDDVRWGAGDFVLAALMLGGIGIGVELASRRRTAATYRAGAAIALLTGTLLIWINLAVGIVGTEGNSANLLFGFVIATAVGGAIAAAGAPAALARAMFATALAQAAVGVAVPLENFGLPALAMLGFTMLWMLSAWLFRAAAKAERGGSF